MNLTLRQSAKVNGYKTVKDLAEAMQLTYDGLYKLYKDRPEEYELRLKAIKERKK